MMKQKKIPMRTCVVTREKYPKKELIRVVRTPEGTVEVDTNGRMNGHGAYLKLDREVILKAKKSKVLNCHLEVEVPDTVYDTLLGMVDEK